MTDAARPDLPRNIQLDRQTVSVMVRLYCDREHAPASGAPCDRCAALLAYAVARLAACPFGEGKTTCRECPVHCYRPAERGEMKVVMREAGPRMLWRHPLLAIRHLWIERQGPPSWPPKPKRRGRGSADPRPPQFNR